MEAGGGGGGGWKRNESHRGRIEGVGVGNVSEPWRTLKINAIVEEWALCGFLLRWLDGTSMCRNSML